MASAANQYRAVIEDFPAEEEAIRSARGYMRTSFAASGHAIPSHDSLYAIWTDESVPWETRASARREAVWALIAGEHYSSAQTEIATIRESDPGDTLWADIMLAVLDLLQTGGGGLDSPAPTTPDQMHARISSFHDRIQTLMGRPTDGEVRSTAAAPRLKDFASAYPNPFNSVVTIKLELPEAMRIKLEVFNLLGQKVATLTDKPSTAGSYSFQWDATNAASGVYVYRLEAGKHVESHKLLLLK